MVKKFFAILFCAVALIVAWMWLKSPQGTRQVDKVLFDHEPMYAQQRAITQKGE